jgi:hypothetical protein
MYRFAMKHRGRLSPSASALQHVAYILRETDGPARAHVASMLRASARTRGREDLIDSGHGNLPAWAAESPSVFWEAAERFERANGRTATTWEVTLPRELTREEQLTAIQDLMQTQFGTRYPYVWALHEGRALDGELNPHFHVAFSSRQMDGLPRSPQQFFARFCPDDPARGGAQKNPRIHWRGALLAQRQAWADIANWHLEHGGHVERLDARSLVRQGLSRAPLKRLSAGELSHAKQAHIYSDALRERLRGHAARQAQWQTENRQATEAWEQRKTQLGLTPDLSHAAFVVHLAAASALRLPRQQETVTAYLDRIENEHRAGLPQHRETVAAYLERALAGIQDERNALESEARLWTRHLDRWERTPPPQVTRGPGYVVHFHDEAPARTRGPQYGR